MIESSPLYVPAATAARVELYACTSDPIATPKLVLAVLVFVKSDKLEALDSLPSTKLLKVVSPDASDADISNSVSNAAGAPPIKSVSSC